MTPTDLCYWLVSHSVSRNEMDKPTSFLFNLYKQKTNLEQKRNTTSEGSQPMNQFSDLTQLSDREPFEWRNDQVLLTKDQMVFVLIFLTFSPRGTYCSLQGWSYTEVKETVRLSGSTGCWFWTDTESGKPQEVSGPLVKVGAFGDEVFNGVLVEVWLTVAPVGLWTHPVIIYPVPECITRINILRNWHNSHIVSLTCGVRNIGSF